ncbi:MAG: Ig-like domain repeat protein [Brevundimonas sp.]
MSFVATLARRASSVVVTLALAAASLLGSSSAALAVDAPTTIRGTVQFPAGYYSLGSEMVSAYATTGSESVSDAWVDEDGAFTLEGLNPSASYQLQFFDFTGNLATGYETDSAALTARAADAALVATGREGVTLDATRSRSVRGTLSYPDGQVLPEGLLLVEPDTQRVVGLAATDGRTSFDIGGGMAGGEYALVLAERARDLYFGGVDRPAVTTAAAAGRVAAGTSGLVVYREAFTATTAPKVTGNPVMNNVLTVATGAWTPDYGSASVQWLRGGVAIAGADQPTYTVSAADVGKAIQVRVTYDGDPTLERYAPGTTTVDVGVIKPGPAPSMGDAMFSAYGIAEVGRTLTASGPYTWPEIDGAKLAYQWLLDGRPLVGATGPSFTLRPSDVHRSIALRVTYTVPGYVPATATTDGVEVSPGAPAKVRTSPKVSGTVKVGKRLAVSPVSWTRSGVVTSYQWLRAGEPVAGATKASYTVTTKDVGSKLSVRVGGTLAGYRPGKATSAATIVVPKVKPAVTATLSSSKAARGATVKVKVKVVAAGVTKPTGTVTVTVGSTKVTATLRSSAKGTVTVRLPSRLAKGSYKVVASFKPTGSTAKIVAKGSSSSHTLKVV